MYRSLPPLRLLTVFETVIRRGGHSHAASELNVSQSAVSQALRQLEVHLGTKLLDRSTRPAGLTEIGRLLHRATVDGLGRIAEAIDEIERLSAGAEQAGTIACSVGFATYWLMPRLTGFYQDHPNIAVNVRTTHQGAPSLEPGVDLAIRFGDGRWDDGAVRQLFSERVDPVCSPKLAHFLKRAGDGLDAATLIHVDVDDERWLSWGEYFRRTKQVGNKRRGLRFTNYVQAVQAALAGQGVMLGWRSTTSDLVREGKLVNVVDARLVPSDAFYLVTAHRPPLSPAGGLIEAWLRRMAAGLEL